MVDMLIPVQANDDDLGHEEFKGNSTWGQLYCIKLWKHLNCANCFNPASESGGAESSESDSDIEDESEGEIGNVAQNLQAGI